MNELYQQDLASFLRFYEEHHICPYYFCSEHELKNFIQSYLVGRTITCDSDFIYFFRCMLKKLVGELDSHTIIRTRDEYDRLPLKLAVSEDSEKVFVVAANEEYQHFVGQEVVGINNARIQRLLTESELAISYSTDGWRKAETGRFLSSKPNLHSLPSITNTREIVYEFAGGEFLEVGNMGEYQDEEVKNYSHETDSDTLTLHFTSCSEEYPGQMKDAVYRLQNLAHTNVKTFILDLSGNMGGSDLIIKPLVEWLSTTSFEKVVKVDRYVQSAGLFAVNDMREIGAKIVGKEIGSSINHIGNNLRHELPSGRFLTIVATRYFYLDKNNGYCTIKTRGEFEKLDPNDIKLNSYIL